MERISSRELVRIGRRLQIPQLLDSTTVVGFDDSLWPWAAAELLDMIFEKESHGDDFANHVAYSPPYFSVSPPVRAANPLVQDARFGNEIISSSPSGLPSPNSASRKGGCVRTSFGLKPAAVRVEGFDCLNRDRQNSSVPAVA